MDPANIFSSKLEMISSLLELQTDGEQDDNAGKQFSLQFVQGLKEFSSSSDVSSSDFTECYNQAVQHLVVACKAFPFLCPEFSKACHTLLKCCLSLVVSHTWKEADATCQQTLCSSLLAAHQYLVPWVGHGFFLAACIAVEPWSHPTLHKILLGQSVAQEEVHAYLTYEGHYLCEQRIKILLEEDYATHALNLSLYCSHDSEMKKNSIYLETLLMLQDDYGKADEMWNEIQWHHCSQDVVPIIESLLTYAVSTAAKVSSMLIVKEWQMETTSLQDMRHITELWVEANWHDCKCNVTMFEERVQETVKATQDTVYRMYLADSIHLLVENEDLAKVCVTLCLGAMCKPPTTPEISYLATSTVDLNNAALCHVIAKIVKNDYPLYRLCLLTAFCITPSQESFDVVEESYITTPDVSSKANPSNLPAAVHCGTVQCMSELLPRMFTPKYRHCDWFSSKPDWFITKKLCERLLKCTKFVSSEWTLSNGEVVTVKTYVKHDMSQSDTSDGDRTTGDSDSCEIISISDDGEPLDSVDDESGEGSTIDIDDDDTDSEMSLTPEKITPRKRNGLANGAYSLRPSRKRIAVSDTDDDTEDDSDVTSWNEWDDSWSEEGTPGRGKVKGHLLNGSKVKGWSPGEKRKETDESHDSSDEKLQSCTSADDIQQTKKKRGRPRKLHNSPRIRNPIPEPDKLQPTPKPEKLQPTPKPEKLQPTPKPEKLGTYSPKRARGRPRKFPPGFPSEIPNKRLCTESVNSDAQVDQSSSAISTDAENIVPASIATVSKAVEPIHRVLKSMMDSHLTVAGDKPVTSASNNHTVCEGHKSSAGDPYLLLKSKTDDTSKYVKENSKTVLSVDNPPAITSVSKDTERVKRTTAVTCNVREDDVLVKQNVEKSQEIKSFVSKTETIGSSSKPQSVCTSSVSAKRTDVYTPSCVTQTVYTTTVKGKIQSRKRPVSTPSVVEKTREKLISVCKTQAESTLSTIGKNTIRVPFCGDSTKITHTPILNEREKTNKINVSSRSNGARLKNVSSSREYAKYPPFPVTSRTNVECSETKANFPSFKAEGVQRTLSDNKVEATESDMAAVETLLSLSATMSQGETEPQSRPDFTTNQQPFAEAHQAVPHSSPSRHQAVTHSSPSRHHAVTHSSPSRHQVVTHSSPSRHQAVTHSSPSRHQAVTHSSPSRHQAATHSTPSRHQAVTLSTSFTHQAATNYTPFTQQAVTHSTPFTHPAVTHSTPLRHPAVTHSTPFTQQTAIRSSPSTHLESSVSVTAYPIQSTQTTSVSFPSYLSTSGLHGYHSGISNSTAYNAMTGTNNTQTCSNVNVLKSPVRTAGQVYLTTQNSPPHISAPPQVTAQNSPSHISAPPQVTAQNSPSYISAPPQVTAQLPSPAHQNVQLIWTARDNNTVTVEYKGKTFKVPVASVPEALSRNLLGQQQAYMTETGNMSPSPARVISIQAPLIATPNLNIQSMAVQNPVVVSPNRGQPVITVQTPVVATPNRTTIQLIPNIQNQQVIATPVQTTTSVLSTNRVPGSNPMQMISVPHTSHGNANSQPASISMQNATNSNSLNFVTTTPHTGIGYFQGGLVKAKYEYGGPSTSDTTNQNVKLVSVPTAPTAGSPPRAAPTQHIRIVYSPHRPVTRSQAPAPRPVTRAYARDSPRFAPWNSSQTRGKTAHQPVKRGSMKSVSGHVLTKPYRTVVPDANGRQTKQIAMPSTNVDLAGSTKRNIPGNTHRRLEILQCSPPSHKPKPAQPLSQTIRELQQRVSQKTKQLPTLAPQIPQPQRIFQPSQQQLQQHQQVHQQYVQQHQQQFQTLHHQQQQKQAIVLVPTLQPTMNVSLTNQPVASTLNTSISQGSNFSLNTSRSTTTTNNVPIQPLSITQGSNISLVTSLPTTVPFYITPTTSASSGLTQLILTTPPATPRADAFSSPFKNIKKYPGKVRKGRLDSR